MSETEATEPTFETLSGIPVKERYDASSLEGWDPAVKLGDPGGFPFTRGPHPTMYRSRQWTRRQVVGLGTAPETNERNHYVIANGQTGISND